jgi:hypothetical protein
VRTLNWLLLVLGAMLCTSLAGDQDNGRRTTHLGPERAVSGLTVAEQTELQRQLHEELSAQMPAGVGQSPIQVEISQQDLDDLAAPHAQGHEPLRIGVVKPVPEGVGKPFGKAFTQGVLQKNPDGSFVWALTIITPGARALRVHLTGFSLPQNTAIYLYGENGQANGPYEGKGRNGDGDFWTRSITGEEGQILLLYQGHTPDVDLPKMSFSISEVAHIRGRPPRPETQNTDTWSCSDNALCLVDASCVNAGPAAPAEDAVAKMEWIKLPYVYTCTGGLLADTDSSSQIPYFLTANHCFSSSIANLETFFNYTTDSCNGTCPDNLFSDGTPPPASTVGITVVATGKAGDFTLATLNQAPPAGATFLGWNNAPVANTDGARLYRISNPNFGPQVYSQHDVDSSSPTCIGWPRGQRIYSVDQTGATMGGSSGSPVLNRNSEVVGQLSGCCGYNCANPCDAGSNWTVDGALAYYWDSVADFLDPQGGDCTIDAECDDGQFCTGPETCNSGTCQSSGDPCGGGEICNETSDACETPACNNDGTCEDGEDCNNCPNDCRSQSSGNPNSRYCCDGALPSCGDGRCSENGWSCGDGGTSCSIDSECDDGQFCNGAEICSAGSCRPGSDPCQGQQGCDEGAAQCVTCGGNKAICTVNTDCCSGNCREGTCKGN